MISAINAEGNREILGVRIGDSESDSFWRETFAWLKDRGIKDVAFVTSDDHRGMGEGPQSLLSGRDVAALSGPLHAECFVFHTSAPQGGYGSRSQAHFRK